MRHGIECVAFDLDGTLYPNYRLNVKLLPFLLRESRLLSAFGKARKIIRRQQENDSFLSDLKKGQAFYKYQAEIIAEILDLSGSLPAPDINGSLPEPDLQPQLLQEKIDRLIYRGWEPLFKNIKLFKMAKETLVSLKEAGFKLSLMSDFPPETKLENLGISGFWDVVLCTEEFGVLKPHPLPFTELAAAMSLPPEKILYVGNSHPYDVAGANRAGMKTAWIRGLFSGSKLKEPKADFIFSNYRQLYEFMLN